MDEPTAILVVDDHPSVAITLADILVAKGFIVFSAISGAEALKILGKQTGTFTCGGGN